MGYKVGNLNRIFFDCRYNRSSVTKTNSDEMEVTVKSVVNCFNNYFKNGYYIFEREKIKTYSESSDIKNHLLDMRFHFSNRHFIKVIISFYNAILSNPNSFKMSFLNFFYKKIYLCLEKISQR